MLGVVPCAVTEAEAGATMHHEYSCLSDAIDVKTAELSFTHLQSKIFTFTLPSHAQPNKLLEVCTFRLRQPSCPRYIAAILTAGPARPPRDRRGGPGGASCVPPPSASCPHICRSSARYVVHPSLPPAQSGLPHAPRHAARLDDACVPGAPTQQWYTHVVPRTSSLSIRPVLPDDPGEDGVHITLTTADGRDTEQDGM